MTEYHSLLTVGGTLLLAVLIMAMVGITWWFDVRHARLPQATRLEDLTQRNTSLLGLIGEKQAELADIQRRIQDRDRIAAEVAALMQQREALTLEIGAMADAEQQIDDLKRRTADAVLQHAETRQLLDTTLAAKEAAEADLKAAQDRLAALPQDQEALRREIERLREDHRQLDNAMAELRNERATLLAAREETVSLTVRKATLEEELVRLIAAQQQQLEARAGLETQLTRMQEEKGVLQADMASLQILKAEAQELSARRPLLVQEIDRLAEERTTLSGGLAALRTAAADAQGRLAGFEAELAELRRVRAEAKSLVARKAALEIDIERMSGDRGTAGGEGDGAGDLRRLPACLAIQGTAPRPRQEESAAIEEVRQSLGRLGLKYNARTINAFHTSLKINEVAQLTVLAGVSGTGKSLLPRRYAEAMGINFLPIAVEPRWDSPQDLLGFYNYVERRYRGTELARALVHMDPQNTSGLSQQPLGDRMLLVLLDEMNLARVEYYFSEFLSRLEIRPRWSPDIGEEARRQASMPLDTRGRDGGSVLLFPSHNVLFVGTMNDDESTQSLSDKVLDRGNVMQFPAPATFERQQAPQAAEPPSGQHLDYGEWRGWIRRPVVNNPAEAQKVQDVINRLAAIMQRCGRPFGHRLNEAVMAYVANYPKSATGRLRLEEALADQIELRILPKLRGVVIDDGDSRNALEDVVTLVRSDLHDSDFAYHLQAMLDGNLNQFNWRGLDRSRV